MSEKPVIFISHSSDDEELALLLKQQIELCFDNGVKPFVAKYSIPAGEEWRNDLTQNLNAAQSLIVLVSPSSSKSRWVGFEIGYLWTKITRKGKGKLPVYPLCLPGNSVFSPLDGIQGKFLDQPEEIKDFFHRLCQQFENGDVKKVDIEAITENVNRSIESLHSEGDAQGLLENFMKHIYLSGDWIIYAKLDQELGFDKGSAARFLKSIAENNGWIVEQETETRIKGR